MDENITNANEGGNTPQEARTFTQEQVNAIIGERLAKERQKAAEAAPNPAEAALALREQELARREFMLTAKETIAARGYPVELLDALRATDATSLEKSLLAIDSIIAQKTKASASAPPPGFRIGAPSGSGHSGPSAAPDRVREAMGLNRLRSVLTNGY